MPLTDVMQLTFTLKMTTAKVVETSVTVNNDSPIEVYVHSDDQIQLTFEMTPGFQKVHLQLSSVTQTTLRAVVSPGRIVLPGETTARRVHRISITTSDSNLFMSSGTTFGAFSVKPDILLDCVYIVYAIKIR